MEPVGSGYVTNLARPGGNASGVSSALDTAIGRQNGSSYSKEIAPVHSRVGSHLAPGNSLPNVGGSCGAAEGRTLSSGVKMIALGRAPSAAEIEGPVTKFACLSPNGGLIIAPHGRHYNIDRQLDHRAGRALPRLPSVYGFRASPSSGGLFVLAVKTRPCLIYAPRSLVC